MQIIPSVFFSKNAQTRWLKVLILISLFLLILVIYNRMYGKQQTEGFDQNKRFLLKRNDDIYDDFYVQVYDDIHPSATRIERELNAIIQATQPSPNASTFLDVGCSTGAIIDYLSGHGYRAYGIDKSNAMVEHVKHNLPTLKEAVQQGDATTDSLLYDRGSFTHILCLDKTIYQMKDKIAFFKNCHHWLKNGGYLVLHVVNNPRFNLTIPSQNTFNPFHFGTMLSSLMSPTPNKPSNTQAMPKILDNGVMYQSKYDTPSSSSSDKHMVFTETFTDKSTANIRQNEQTLYMEEMSDIINDALFCGFFVHGKWGLKDGSKVEIDSVTEDANENHFLYILEKTM